MSGVKLQAALIIALGWVLLARSPALAGLFDDLPKPNSPPGSSTQPATTEQAPLSGEAAEDAYRDAVHKARADYLQSLIDIDQRFLSQLDQSRKAAVKAGDDAEVQRIDGRSAAIIARLKEHQASLDSARANGKPEIISAQWGMGNHWADVTAKIKELAALPQAVRANPDTLGADPAHGWHKTLQIVYVKDGQSHTVSFREDEEIRIEDLIPAIVGGV